MVGYGAKRRRSQIKKAVMAVEYWERKAKSDRLILTAVLGAVLVATAATIVLAQLLGSFVYFVVGFLVVWMVFIENSWLRVEKLNVVSPKLDKSVRIVQISDLHTNRLVVRSIVGALRKMKFGAGDVIVFTGDTFDCDRKQQRGAERLFAEISGLECKKYLIFGNHETERLGSEFLQGVRKTAEDAGAVYLSEISALITEKLRIFGLDFDRDKEFRRLDENCFNVLVTHAREQAEAQRGFDLVLCGHEHGGQIRLPFLGGVAAAGTTSLSMLFPELRGERTRGKYEKDGTIIYIDSGCGWSNYPIRLFNRVQISLITLTPEVR